ncbi:MAG: hypothetical protein OEV73_10705 [Desulfobulbaceae bacterium]|nr:hypothetical protein [Desulfobulbaceae bacterium]
MTTQTLAQRKEAIILLMQYAVPAEQMHEARQLLDRYQSDIVAANLLHAFYSYLPEGLDDGVRELRLLARRQGAFLLAAVTFHATYLYLATADKAEYLGDSKEGVWDEEVRTFFELGSREAFLKKTATITDFPLHIPAPHDEELCPACAAADGEEHILGCPVEICPWCGGQLTGCHCRFEQLDRDHLLGERELAALEEKLKEKGRIPYDSGKHRPAYPTAGDDGPTPTH